ncbi:hypothetical protein BDV36DRAFT_143980 [Aspergillus pseudocaelatus]|uniref:Uncharacterized protein n=1 Tax=Aspergillus pseudocaelatus TaxID=1825620 RepID=A0ABQ6WPV4_9EURO|nr:hypothetical protein BDV36DRAFT_143980 [Aspergillus pseudocaelatus]
MAWLIRDYTRDATALGPFRLYIFLLLSRAWGCLALGDKVEVARAYGWLLDGRYSIIEFIYYICHRLGLGLLWSLMVHSNVS